MPRYLASCVVLLCVIWEAQGQSKGLSVKSSPSSLVKGSTYALVVGISDYENEMIRDLNFAESDARAFAGFLKSKSGGNVPTNNIIGLYGKDASSTNIWQKGIGYYFLNKRMFKPGDRFILYFSGHGGSFNISDDIAERDNAYFFVWDANSQTDGDANLKISQVKDLVHTLVEEGVQVIFIFDACRSDVGVKGGIEKVNEIVERAQGEVVLTATKGGKVAYESHRLGHGVFTYYLLRGLYGEADEDNDGILKGIELDTYLKKWTRSFSKEEFKDEQIPFALWGPSNKFEEKKLFEYDSLEGKLAIASMQMKTLSAIQGQQLGQNNKGFAKWGSSENEDPIALFDRALNSNRIIRPINDCAYYYFEKMTKSKAKEEVISQMRTSLSIALFDMARKVINDDLEGKRKYILKGDHQSAINRFSEADQDYYQLPLEALNIYTSITPIQAANPSVNSMAAYCSARQAHLRQAGTADIGKTINDISIEIRAQPSKAYLYFARGVLFYSLGNFDSAIKDYKKAWKLSPLWTYPLVAISSTFYDALHQHDSANHYLNKINKKNLQDFGALFELGYLKLEFEEYDSAGYYLRKSLQINNKNIDAWVNLGNVKTAGNDYDSASLFYHRALAIAPDNWQAFANLAYVKNWSEELDSSIYYWRKVIRLEPKNDEAYLRIGNAKYLLDQTDSAFYYYSAALKLNGKNGETYSNIATVHYDLGEYDSACFYFKKTVALLPDFSEAYQRLGDASYLLGNNDEALKAYKKTIQIDSMNADGYHGIANVLADQASYAEAIVAYKKAIKLRPNDATILKNIGLTLYEQKKLPEAIIAYRESVKLKPNAETYHNLGLALNDLGKASEAIEAFQQAIGLNPALPNPYISIGFILGKQGRAEDAIKANLKAIELDPQSDIAYVNLGLNYYSQGKNDGAIKAFQKAIELNPQNADSYCNLARMHSNGDYDKAIETYENAIQIDSLCLNCYYGIGLLYLEHDQLEKAKLNFEKAIPLAEQDSTMLAFIRLRLGHRNEAKELLHCLVEKYPTNPIASYNYAAYFSVCQESSQALEWLEKSFKLGYDDWLTLSIDDNIENIRNLPAFKKLVAKYKK